MIEKTFPILEKLLANGLKSTQKLFELLNAEHEQLKAQKDPMAIDALASHKKEVVTQLEQFSKQLGQVLATEKLLMSQDGINHYFAKAKTTGINISDAFTCWSEISDLSKTCRSLNEQNGASIDLLGRHAQRALHVLRGKSQLNTTYGPDGSTRSELFSHTLISV
ncbi:MAG: flagellar biosynthesis protein FlgN [Methylomonas sp.]|nr:MAG: flagellar biosynthesis protein FlgN [Methylomonas sp.]